MNRRDLLAVAGTVPPALLAGCLGHTSLTGLDPVDPPEWPDEPTESAVTWYAARYRVVKTYNQTAEAQSPFFRGELVYACGGAFEADTAAGFVVNTFGTSHFTERRLWYSAHGHGVLSPEALLVNEDETIRAPLEEDSDDPPRPPYPTRGLSLVNFSPVPLDIEVSIEYIDGENEGGDRENEAESTTFAEVFELEAERGRTLHEVVAEPDEYGVNVAKPGEYEVNVAVADDVTTHRWSVSDEPREATRLPVGIIGEIALGVYVLPDGSVEIHEIPEERTTETEGISQRTAL